MGLFLALLLRQNNISCLVLEKRTARITHSRSLGIHPVSLELMQEIGLAERFTGKGITVRRGIAWGDSAKIGSLSFEHCPPPYRFVLTLPQYKTETILEEALREFAPSCLVRGAEVTQLKEYGNRIETTIRYNNEHHKLTSRFIVGCDGKESDVRQKAGFAFEGKRYPDSYIMGDFSDHTKLGTTAGIFLHRTGLVESFPLPEDRRRWVVKTKSFIKNPGRREIEKRVRKRTGYKLGKTDNYMLSSFGVQRYLAKPMARKRTFLAGDAAHIVSPIGGQGMNLGWLDAWDLANRLREYLDQPSRDYTSIADRYSKNRRKAARKAIRRAELNMRLGRESRFPLIKNSLVWLMLNTPLERLMARIFTMRGI